MSKSVPQLTEKTSLSDDDLFHFVRSNVDYKIKKQNVLGANLQYFKITLTTAQVLALDTTPITLIAAPGAGYATEVKSAFARIASYGGTPYATSTDLYIYTDTANLAQLCQLGSASSILESTVARATPFYYDSSLIPSAATQTCIIENKAILISPLSGSDPTAGNSDIIIYGTYRTVTL